MSTSRTCLEREISLTNLRSSIPIQNGSFLEEGIRSKAWAVFVIQQLAVVQPSLFKLQYKLLMIAFALIAQWRGRFEIVIHGFTAIKSTTDYGHQSSHSKRRVSVLCGVAVCCIISQPGGCSPSDQNANRCNTGNIV